MQFRQFEVSGIGTERLRYGRFALACRQADGTPRQIFTGEGEKSWVSLDALGPLLPAAVIAAEDQRFDEKRPAHRRRREIDEAMEGREEGEGAAFHDGLPGIGPEG